LELGIIEVERFIEPATKRLYAAYQNTANRISEDSSIDEFLFALSTLVDPITTFFDQVLVMAEEEGLRHNRLALLQKIADLSNGIVDLSRLQGF
jgi:glycyl-tRNA synthetase